MGIFQIKSRVIPSTFLDSTLHNLTVVGAYSLGFIILIGILLFLRWIITKSLVSQSDATWSCGYAGEIKKAQYTASSFIRTYRKLAQPILSVKKEKIEASGIYPNSLEQITHPHDKIETFLIHKPIYLLKRILNRFVFLQNGNIQSYILYGFIFLVSAIVFPILISKIMVFINFLNQL